MPANTNPSFPVTAAQARALALWVYVGDHAAAVQLTSQRDGSLSAVQGDECALFEVDGRTVEGEYRR